VGRLIALAVLAATVAAGWAGPTLLQAVLPWQARLLESLTPGFMLRQLSIESTAGHWHLAAQLVSREHLVLHGRVIEPGLQLQAHTPARGGQRLLGVAALWLAWCCWRRLGDPSLGATRLAAVTALVLWPLAIALPAVVLSGQIWALLVPTVEPTLAWVLAWSSDRLLQGADLAIAVAAAYLTTPPHRP
jgi:hypothetical protein